MDILQELNDSLNSSNIPYHEFLLRYNPNKKQVFAFYEGNEDGSFYGRFLEGVIGNDWELEEIVVGCKNNVVKLWKDFNWDIYNPKQIAFFVDQDLSYWLNETTEYGENVFVTDEYSIENYVVNSLSFKSWLCHYQGFARVSKKDLQNMIDEYILNIEKFKCEMSLIMAQAVVAKRHNNSISLNAFKLSRGKNLIFKVHEGHLDFEIRKDNEYQTKWNLSSKHDLEISEQQDLFNRYPEHYSVRGKWILFFMAEMGVYMRLNVKKFAPSLYFEGKKLHPTCGEISTAKCLATLAPYSMRNAPESLNRFLDGTYRMYIHEIETKNTN